MKLITLLFIFNVHSFNFLNINPLGISPSSWAKSFYNIRPASPAKKNLMACARRIARKRLGGTRGVRFLGDLLEGTKEGQSIKLAYKKCKNFRKKNSKKKISDQLIYRGLKKSRASLRTKKFLVGLYRPYAICSYVGGAINSFYANYAFFGLPEFKVNGLVGNCISTHGKVWIDFITGAGIRGHFPLPGVSLGGAKVLVGRIRSPYTAKFTKLIPESSGSISRIATMIHLIKNEEEAVSELFFLLDPTSMEHVLVDSKFNNDSFYQRLNDFKNNKLDIYNLYNFKSSGFQGLGIELGSSFAGFGIGLNGKLSTFSFGYFNSLLANTFFSKGKSLKWPVQI